MGQLDKRGFDVWLICLVLLPALASEWLAPKPNKDRAKDIARDHSQPVEDYAWYPLSIAPTEEATLALLDILIFWALFRKRQVNT